MRSGLGADYLRTVTCDPIDVMTFCALKSCMNNWSAFGKVGVYNVYIYILFT